jgi:hypothetical protein
VHCATPFHSTASLQQNEIGVASGVQIVAVMQRNLVLSLNGNVVVDGVKLYYNRANASKVGGNRRSDTGRTVDEYITATAAVAAFTAQSTTSSTSSISSTSDMYSAYVAAFVECLYSKVLDHRLLASTAASSLTLSATFLSNEPRTILRGTCCARRAS